ncbi:MAG: FAD-dependent oxidoreductase [Actinoallomurus sp.]
MKSCPRVRPLLGMVDGIDIAARRVTYLAPDDERRSLAYDRVVLAVGSVNKLLPIPGVAEHAYGFRSMAEAIYLRDAILRDIELAEATGEPAERAARCSFVMMPQHARRGAGLDGPARRHRTTADDSPGRWDR